MILTVVESRVDEFFLCGVFKHGGVLAEHALVLERALVDLKADEGED